MGRLSVFAEFLGFLKARRKWWFIPIVVFLALFGILLLLSEISSIAPFIYALF